MEEEMEEFYAEGLATHSGPESCVHDPQGRGEALTPGKARHGGDGPGRCLDYVSGISQPPSTYSLTTYDLTSQRTG